jgi:hypothetical protein
MKRATGAQMLVSWPQKGYIFKLETPQTVALNSCISLNIVAESLLADSLVTL